MIIHTAIDDAMCQRLRIPFGETACADCVSEGNHQVR